MRSRYLHYRCKFNGLSAAAAVRAGRPASQRLAEPGLPEQGGKRAAQQLARLMRVQAEIGAQRLPERPDRDRMQRVGEPLPRPGLQHAQLGVEQLLELDP